jgi:RimJ/RimL family protein N-acetyltransferase
MCHRKQGLWVHAISIPTRCGHSLDALAGLLLSGEPTTMLLEAEDHHFEMIITGGALKGCSVAPEGIAPAAVLEMLRALATEVRQQFRPAAWWMVEEDEVVGLCSFKAAPSNDGAVEIGYGVAPSRQGRGVGRRAIIEVLKWAQTASLSQVLAETAVANLASQRVLQAIKTAQGREWGRHRFAALIRPCNRIRDDRRPRVRQCGFVLKSPNANWAGPTEPALLLARCPMCH